MYMYIATHEYKLTQSLQSSGLVYGFKFSFFFLNVFIETAHIKTVKELVKGSNKPHCLNGVRVTVKLKGISYWFTEYLHLHVHIDGKSKDDKNKEFTCEQYMYICKHT